MFEREVKKMITGKVYFKDGHTEDTVFIRPMGEDRIEFCTNSGLYACQKEFYDELKYYPITSLSKYFYGFYKYNQEVRDWFSTNDIEEFEFLNDGI